MSSNIFKIYSKQELSNSNDSIFSIIGKTEPDLTKSLAFLLHYSPNLLERFIGLIGVENGLQYSKSFIAAEQRPDVGNNTIRRDITVLLHYKDSKKKTLIVVEAKSLFKTNIDTHSIEEQLNNYFNENDFSDVRNSSKKIAVSLTKEKIIFKNSLYTKFDIIKSITWKDIIHLLEEDDYLLKAYREEIMKSNFIKTYEEEVFCPPAGDTYKKIKELGIYCCPSERTLRNAIYLMPRIPVKNIENELKVEFNLDTIDNYKGKGCSLELYAIIDSFIVSADAIEMIENKELKGKVIDWGISNSQQLKVFVLGKRMSFSKPKFTEDRNNTWNGYFSLADIWGDSISKKR